MDRGTATEIGEFQGEWGMQESPLMTRSLQRLHRPGASSPGCDGEFGARTEKLDL